MQKFTVPIQVPTVSAIHWFWVATRQGCAGLLHSVKNPGGLPTSIPTGPDPDLQWLGVRVDRWEGDEALAGMSMAASGWMIMIVPCKVNIGTKWVGCAHVMCITYCVP